MVMHGASLLLPEDEEIVRICEPQFDVDNSGFLIKCAIYPSPENPQAFVKHGDEEDGLLAEARNQEFAYKAISQQNQQDIRIPEIYRVFSRGGKVYIVMEYIHGKTVGELQADSWDSPRLLQCYDQIIRAINFFLSIPVPKADAVPPGPVGGGVIRHPLFKMAIAPRLYSSIADLQKHLEAVANYRPNAHKIDFSNEALCFCYSDLYEGNFISTESGLLYIIDFGHASILPTSFMSYALNRADTIHADVGQEIQLPRNNLEALEAAGYYFMLGVC